MVRGCFGWMTSCSYMVCKRTIMAIPVVRESLEGTVSTKDLFRNGAVLTVSTLYKVTSSVFLTVLKVSAQVYVHIFISHNAF